MSTERILKYKEIAAIPQGENGEMLVDVRVYDTTIVAQYEKTDMVRYIGDVVLVRDTVAHKLANINAQFLSGEGLRLKIVYGYRHPDIQKKYFEQRRDYLKLQSPDLTDDQLNELTHDFVASPDVAGHPTGGAIDVTLVDKNGVPLDCGTRIADFSKPEAIQTFSKSVTEEQMKNRLLLREKMLDANFAPFNGEWWHFSYGDREWACYYEQPSSIYGVIYHTI